MIPETGGYTLQAFDKDAIYKVDPHPFWTKSLTMSENQLWNDSDGDSVKDNIDEFPTDETEINDIDRDEVGDNRDEYPNDLTRSFKLEITDCILDLSEYGLWGYPNPDGVYTLSSCTIKIKNLGKSSVIFKQRTSYQDIIIYGDADIVEFSTVIGEKNYTTSIDTYNPSNTSWNPESLIIIQPGQEMNLDLKFLLGTFETIEVYEGDNVEINILNKNGFTEALYTQIVSI